LPPKAEPAEVGLKIVDTSHAREVERGDKVIPSGTGFHLPSFEFLDPPEGGVVEVHADQLKATAALLEKTLSDYGVSGKVEEIHPGPTVTTFEVSPAAGTKVSKVASLADDLALGLARKVRIVAPIPGKNRIGFELPNPKRVPVNMRELVEDRRFLELKAPLPCRARARHRRCALLRRPRLDAARHRRRRNRCRQERRAQRDARELLYRRTPDELRMLMIDPKVVELAPFDGIPHMLLPVVTDMKQAATALKWAVDEMERRYQLFANAGTKNITTYNGFVERVLRGEAKPPKPLPGKVNAIAADGTDVELDPAKDGSDTEPLKKLPFIVIVVDEFADLMMQQGKEVEVSVARLAQKARAAGMHVILATQRPSVDVITGMIKANFPTRVAFRVAQKVDSRTILDEQGAEHLLGRGDMLIKMNGSNDTRRVQCPFISRRGGAEGHRLPPPAGHARVRREHPQAARRRREGRSRGRRRRRPALRPSGAHRRRDAQVLDLVAAAQARHRLQPRGQARRDDGAPRARRAGQRLEGSRSLDRGLVSGRFAAATSPGAQLERFRQRSSLQRASLSLDFVPRNVSHAPRCAPSATGRGSSPSSPPSSAIASSPTRLATLGSRSSVGWHGACLARGLRSSVSSKPRTNACHSPVRQHGAHTGSAHPRASLNRRPQSDGNRSRAALACRSRATMAPHAASVLRLGRRSYERRCDRHAQGALKTSSPVAKRVAARPIAQSSSGGSA
jgi:DNA segregation ATPase FtsK/SpoIIIE, S-DNA-T family